MNENIRKFDEFMSRTLDNEQIISIENQINQHITLIEITDETRINLDKYINAITLVSKGIVSYNIRNPKDLFLELDQIKSKYTLPIKLSIETTYIYYKLMNIKSFIRNNLLVITFDIPLVNTISYDLFEIHSLPTPHKNDTTLLSYIEPNKPYILVSVTRTVYSTLNNIQNCQEYLPTQWLCRNIQTSKRVDQENCQIQLFFKTRIHIPKTCRIRHIFAEAEIWHKISDNQWLFILSKPTSVNIICNTNKEYEEILQKVGIITLDTGCKAYIDYTVLEVENIVGIHNITSKIPSTDITNDECCQQLKENITIKGVKLQPMTVTNIDLSELKYAQHKLSQFDEILQQQLQQLTTVHHRTF